MQTTVAKGVAMTKFCSDPNKNAIFFIFMKVLMEKIFDYDKGENKDHIFSIFQIWQNLQFYKKFCVRPPYFFYKINLISVDPQLIACKLEMAYIKIFIPLFKYFIK